MMKKVTAMLTYRTCQEGAKVISRLFSTHTHFGTQAPKELLGFLDEAAFLSRKLADFDDSFLRQMQNLSAVKQKQVLALQAFCEPKCVEFVKWLREHLPSKHDFQTMIQLADISAESDQDISRLQILDSAVNGFEALIYSEKGQSFANWKTLIENLKNVFDKVETRTDLHQNIGIASTLVAWLTAISGKILDLCIDSEYIL